MTARSSTHGPGAPATALNGPEKVTPPLVPKNLVEMILHRAGYVDPFLTFVSPVGEDRVFATGTLLHRARLRGAGLLESGLRPGDRVLLLLPNEPDFVETLFGMILAGVVPVIYPPPQTARVMTRYMGRLEKMLQQCEPAAAVVDEKMLESSKALGRSGVRFLKPPLAERPLRTTANPDPEDLALVQYSSGSTGDPKGVMLSHRAILANGWATGEAMDSRRDDVIFSWLPYCHDMGLFGGLIFPWLLGWRAIHATPIQFLFQPSIWLQGISQYRVTIATAPNFAYGLCLLGIDDEELEGVDLSCIRVAFNGAEPIQRSTLEGFAKRFQRWGLRAEVLLPVYGMAENTLAVAFPPLGRGPVFDRIFRSEFEATGRAVPAPAGAGDLKEVAALGKAVPGTEIAILDEKGRTLPERLEGAIHLRGSSMLGGYLGNPEATARAMARIAGGARETSGEKRRASRFWLRTGDRGYMAHGELYVTGRESDMLIRAGRNLHPHDIEAVVSEVVGVRRGCTVAVGFVDPVRGTERIFVLAETRVKKEEDLIGLSGEIRRAVFDAFGFPPDSIVLLEPRELPKTTSGKLQRKRSGRLFQEGKLKVVPLAPGTSVTPGSGDNAPARRQE